MKAFTLMELLVAMALMAILSVLSFYAYQLVQQQYLFHQKISIKVGAYQNFVALLQKDIYEAQYVERQFQQLLLKNKKITINYFFRDSTVERFHSLMPHKIDTLKIQVAWQATYFNDKTKEHGLIDHGQVLLKAFGEQQVFSFSKSYSSLEHIEISQ